MNMCGFSAVKTEYYEPQVVWGIKSVLRTRIIFFISIVWNYTIVCMGIWSISKILSSLKTSII